MTTTVPATEELGTEGCTHVGRCVFCGRLTHIAFVDGEAVVRESCRHFAAVVQTGGQVEVEFMGQRSPWAPVTGPTDKLSGHSRTLFGRALAAPSRRGGGNSGLHAPEKTVADSFRVISTVLQIFQFPPEGPCSEGATDMENEPEVLAVEVATVIEKLIERQSALEMENAILTRRMDELDGVCCAQQVALKDSLRTLRELIERNTGWRPPSAVRPAKN